MPEICHLFISSGHNYVGHHGQAAGEHPIHEVDSVECVAGRGIRGDRYFDREQNHKGQIAFFALESHDAISRALRVPERPPSVYRRNVITRGVDLNSLVGQEFELQGIRFMGVEECRPCHWMDEALAPGAEDMLKGRGGLRARILTDGVLRKTRKP